ncbi:hypothetical protein PDENDC454_24734 [Paenibacillus dendritiformis C454]|uniref:Uncharacterized protein n=1 Tax=Paenibacillus dendritiformis C454 TaxID=1131935 RepID=H3SMZ9_9BACL|nr:hypothetical protein PDENDC454_24734 [Paenibacillus dendritiformis C454]
MLSAFQFLHQRQASLFITIELKACLSMVGREKTKKFYVLSYVYLAIQRKLPAVNSLQTGILPLMKRIQVFVTHK